MGMIDTQISLSARVRMCAVGRSGHAWFKLLPTEHVTSQRNERSNARIVIDNKFTSRHASRTHSRAGAPLHRHGFKNRAERRGFN